MTPEELQAQLEQALEKINQVTSQIDGLTTKNNELESQLTNISEENARYKRIIEEFGNKTPPAKTELPDSVTDPVGFAEAIKTQLREEQNADAQQRDEMQRRVKAVREAFFKAFPHLADHEPLVAFFSNQMLSEPGNEKIGQSEAFKEVARRCDEYITKHAKGSVTPPAPHVGDPGKKGKGDEGTPPPSTLTPTEEAIKERRENLAKKSLPPS